MSEGERTGARVRALRREKRLTKVEFGDLFGVSPRTVYSWERDGPPAWARLALAAYVYELPPWPPEERGR